MPELTQVDNELYNELSTEKTHKQSRKSILSKAVFIEIMVKL